MGKASVFLETYYSAGIKENMIISGKNGEWQDFFTVLAGR